MQRLLDSWWGRRRPLWLLLPLSWLYAAIVRLRRRAYAAGILRSQRLAVPVVVVGNLTVGGSGKTPLVIWLAEQLQQRGLRPGIISRGYGGRSRTWPRAVTPDSDPSEVGDEPVLIAQRTGCPLVVGPDRIADGRMLLDSAPCDLILADDGLQHYRLQRDFEILVVDGERRFGNGHCLPLGPLREPAQRRRQADRIVVNGGQPKAGELPMRLVMGPAEHLADPARQRPLADFRADGGCHAVAGIGNPERFFRQLEAAGLGIERHPFPDHHAFAQGQLEFHDQKAVLMTEKDGVKYRPYATERHWAVPVEAELDEGLADEIIAALGRE